MAYLGINPQLRAYQDSMYVASKGETKLPLKAGVEVLLVKNGVILAPDGDYYKDSDNRIVLTVPASAGDEIFMINLSTFSFSNTVSKDELEEALSSRQDPLFSVIWLPNRNVIPAGYVPADGQLELRSMYPTAAEKIENNLVPVVTEVSWSAGNQRASYTTGDGSTNFRVPDYNGKNGGRSLFIRGDGSGADSAGVIQGDAIRNITGNGQINVDQPLPTMTGAFYASGPWERAGVTSNFTTRPQYDIHIDASRVVPTADENRPVNVAGVWCIRLAHKPVQTGIMTANGVIEKINEIASIQNDVGTILFEGNISLTQAVDISDWSVFKEIEVVTVATPTSTSVPVHLSCNTIKVRNINKTGRHLFCSYIGSGAVEEVFYCWLDFLTNTNILVTIAGGSFWSSVAVTQIIGYK